MNRRQTTLHALLAVLLVTTLLPVGNAASDPATDAQETAIKAVVSGNSGPKGSSTLQGEWATRGEIHTLYPLMSGAAAYGGLPNCNCANGVAVLYNPVTGNVPNPVADPVPAIPFDVVASYGDATFTMGRAGADGEVSALAASLYLNSLTTFPVDVDLLANGVAIASVRVLSGGNPSTSLIEGPYGGNFAGAPSFSGYAPMNPPAAFKAGDELALRFQAVVGDVNTADELILQYGHTAVPSSVQIFTDGARVNAWTENLAKQANGAFPIPGSTNVADRTMVLRVAHINNLGTDGVQTYNHFLQVVGPDGKIYYDNVLASFGPGTQPTTNVATDQKWGAAFDDLSTPTKNEVTGQEGLHFASYKLTYPATLEKQGTYLLRIGARSQAWQVDVPVTVGGAASALTRSTLEQSPIKEILIGERTTFRVTVTNAGLATDTFALNAELGATPSGWAASVTPAQVTLSPGTSSDVIVTVSPSILGTNAQQNTVKVTATSLLSGVASQLRNAATNADELLVVRLTSTKVLDAPRLIVPTAIAPINPGGNRIIPIAVENQGNARDRFVLSVEGVPAGWTVTATPSLLDLDAKSQAAPVLKVQAPPEATRGQSFPFTLRAVRADDATKAVTQIFTVQVVQLNKLTFSVFDGSNSDGTPKLVTTSSLANPIVHKLRDEGPDGRVYTDDTGFFTSSAWDADQDWDMDYDQSTLYRLVLTNDGDTDDRVRVIPKLLTSDTGFSKDLVGTDAIRDALGYQDLDGCEQGGDNGGAGDKLNDGWRFRMWDPASSTIPPLPGRGGDSAVTQNYDDVLAFEMPAVNIPARSTKVLYVEMGWHVPDTPLGANVIGQVEACGQAGNDVQADGAADSRGADPAPGHAVAIEAISLNDPAQRSTHVLNAKIIGAAAPGASPTRIASQRYSDQINGVALALDTTAADGKTLFDVASKTVQLTTDAAGRTATYSLRAVNTGNEFDTIRITVPQFQGGWEYGLSSVVANSNLVSKGLGEGHGKAMRDVGCSAPAVQNPSASTSARILGFECTLGAWDEVSFRLTATAPAGGPLGVSDLVTVTAQSKDSFSAANAIFDDVQVRTAVTGAFIFNLLPDAAQTSLLVQPGQTAGVPFTIRNLGTRSDNFTLDLPVAPLAGSGWSGDFSQTNPVFVPAGREVSGFLLVRAPSGAATNDQERFRIRATGLDAGTNPLPADFADITVTVVGNPTALNVSGEPQDVVSQPGQAATLTVKATKAASSTATYVDLNLDASSLPAGWTTSATATAARVTYVNGVASKTFTVTSPADALGTSRVAVRATAVDSNGVGDFTYIGVSLSSPTVGVDLASPSGTTVLVAPGAATVTTLTVENLGVGQDTIHLSAPTVPTGWVLAFEASDVAVQPLQKVPVNVTVTAPANLAIAQSVLIRLVATTGDGTRTDLLDLNFTTGVSVPLLKAKAGSVLTQLPEETFRFALTVSNNGTLGDDLNLVSNLTGAFKDLVQVKFDPASVQVEPGQSRDVLVEVTLPAGLAPGVQVPVVLEARSKGPFLHAVGNASIPVKVIDHKVRDIDGDLINEYAVDRNLDPSDGYEQMRDPNTGGAASRAVDPAQLLSNAAKASHTVVVTGTDGNSTSVLSFLFDADEDQLTDMLVDSDGDGVQDVYWDPDRGYSHALPKARDVTKDGRVDDFIDTDGVDGLAFDVYYDAYNGVFGALLQLDVDNNGEPDYVVDANGNGQADPDETVLFGGPTGAFVAIQQKRDVDGDGETDTVIDSDGDGNPDYFVPAGTQAGVPIVLEDVNGDGIEDWTYDADGDGRRDSYFDPATGQSGLLDTTSDFLGQLKEYWYIGALFGVVLALFVVLLLVTRK